MQDGAAGEHDPAEALVELALEFPFVNKVGHGPAHAGAGSRLQVARTALASAARGRHARGEGVPKQIDNDWTQVEISRTIRKMFPEEWTFEIPFLEDIASQPPFNCFRRWAKQQGYRCGTELADFHAGVSGWQHATVHRQRLVLGAKGAIDPIVGYHLDPEVHMRKAVEFAKDGALPFDLELAAPVDLRFAAAQLVENAARLREYRKETRKAFGELSRRCLQLSTALKKYQPGHVAAVAAKMHVGLMAVLVVLTSWHDWRLPMRFVTGFSTTGILERTGVYQPVEPVIPLSREQHLEAGRKTKQLLECEPEAIEKDFIWQSLQDETAKGWASHQMSRQEVDKYFRDEPGRQSQVFASSSQQARKGELTTVGAVSTASPHRTPSASTCAPHGSRPSMHA